MPAAPIAAFGGGMSSSSGSDPLRGAVRIVQERLYYASFKSSPPRSDGSSTTDATWRPIHYFNIDEELVYWNFFLDFGPLNLGQLYRFCVKLNEKLEDPRLSDRTICYYSSAAPAKRANAVFLICAWQVLYLDRTPEEAFLGFRADGPAMAAAAAAAGKDNRCSLPPVRPQRGGLMARASSSGDGNAAAPLPPFHDASPCLCTYELTVLDCLRGLAKARSFNFFDFSNFDVDEYEYFEQVENGDLNWIIQGKILAFAGPHYRRQITPEGYCTLTPAEYIPYFRKKNVGLVVRLNKKCYDENEFTNAGIDFVEQYYLDGSCPPMKILQRVVAAFEAVPPNKGFAVHCKAGLGRTGTCIGAYIMKHYKFTAAEVIGWMRICRPGMVIGPQQHFLRDLEQRMWAEGDAMRAAAAASASQRSVPLAIKPRGKYEGSIGLDQNSPVAVTNLPFETLTVCEPMQAERGEGGAEENGEHSVEAIYGRPGQGVSLLARRTHLHHQHSTGSAGSSGTNSRRPEMPTQS
mmetsp:Transcript_10726/g.31746  ORF Transcript_10726/g.31746 Transcript_10726/m.31746 type:complete len:519 (-) Transcript_10726:211-1767(-)